MYLLTHLQQLHISGSYHLLLSKARRRYSSHSISRRISQLSLGALREERGKINNDNYAVSRCPHQWCRGSGSCYWRGRLWSQLGIWRWNESVEMSGCQHYNLTNLYSPDSFPLMLLTIRRDVSLSLVWKVALSPKWLGLDQMRAKVRSVSPLTSTLQILHCQHSIIKNINYKSRGYQLII